MICTMQEFVQAFKAARRVSTPLVAVRTADPASTIQTIQETLKDKENGSPLLERDPRPRGAEVAIQLSDEENAIMLGRVRDAFNVHIRLQTRLVSLSVR